MKNATSEIKVGTQFACKNFTNVNGVVVESEIITVVVKITPTRVISENPNWKGRKQIESFNTIETSINNGFRRII